MGVAIQEKTRPTQYFNMATIFQDGRHRVSLNVIFCFQNGSWWSKRLLWQQSVCFGMKNVQLMLWILFKCSGYFNMAANLQDGCHRLSRNTSFALNGSRQKYDLQNKWYIWTCRQFSWTMYYYTSTQISPLWPPISKMATMGYPKILSFTFKITAASQIRRVGKIYLCT